MPCCIIAAFLFGLLVRSWRKMRGRDPEPVPTIPKPVVRTSSPLTDPISPAPSAVVPQSPVATRTPVAVGASAT